MVIGVQATGTLRPILALARATARCVFLEIVQGYAELLSAPAEAWTVVGHGGAATVNVEFRNSDSRETSSMRKLQFAIGALAILGLSMQSVAQAAPKTDSAASNRYRFRLLGVYDASTGEAVEGVEVADVLNKASSMTSKTGTVSLFFLPDGGGLVRLRKIGYETQTLAVSISPSDTVPITVILAHATALPAVVVKDSAPKFIPAALRQFEEHRKAGFGHFLDDSAFRRGETSTLANFLTAHMPGILSVPGPGSAKYIASGRKGCAGPALRTCRSPDCYVSVYLDGAKIYDAGTPGMIRVDFEHLSPIDYSAAEFYQGAEIPPEYNSAGNSCGVLVLWSRMK